MTARCPACRTRRATFASLMVHVKASGHTHCNCGGYHFPHRPGSPCCNLNPMAPAHQADRAGATPEEVREIAMDIQIDLALSGTWKHYKDWL